jgi:hypothetical protein
MKFAARLAFFLTLSFLAFQASAQATMPEKGKISRYKDGVARKFGKMIEIKKGKEMPLSRTYTAENGTKVMADGTVIFQGGKKEKLKEGYAVNRQGEKVILEDDMIAPDAIREHQKEVTGTDETVINYSEKTKVIINDSTGRKAVKDTIRNYQEK